MADIKLPELKSDAAKELAPYLLTILRTQALLLEKAGYQVPQLEGAAQSDKDEIYDDLLKKVALAAAPEPAVGERATVRQFKGSRPAKSSLH